MAINQMTKLFVMLLQARMKEENTSIQKRGNVPDAQKAAFTASIDKVNQLIGEIELELERK